MPHDEDLDARDERLRQLSGAVLADAIERIAANKAAIRAKMEAANAACEPIRKDTKRIKDRLEDAGFPAAQTDLLILEHDLRRRIEGLGAKLASDDERHVLAVLRESLGDFGDTPLGRATMAAEGLGDDAQPDLKH